MLSLDIRYLDDSSLHLNDLPALYLEDSKPRRLSVLKALYLEDFLCGRLSYLECPLPWQFSSLYLEHCMSTMLSSSLSKRLCVLKALFSEGSLSRRFCVLIIWGVNTDYLESISVLSLDIRYLEDSSLHLNDSPALYLEDSPSRRRSILKAL